MLFQIKWENRFNNSIPEQVCFCSLDGVDFQIMEPTPFSVQWYSHKFKGPGLRYEIGICINTGDIVWVNGGYPCGCYSDLKLAREGYTDAVNIGELTMADKGYNDPNYFILPTSSNSDAHNLVMARHETVNKRIRQFNILKNVFRNSIHNHQNIFFAIVNLTQLMIENGNPLFSLNIE